MFTRVLPAPVYSGNGPLRPALKRLGSVGGYHRKLVYATPLLCTGINPSGPAVSLWRWARDLINCSQPVAAPLVELRWTQGLGREGGSVLWRPMIGAWNRLENLTTQIFRNFGTICDFKISGFVRQTDGFAFKDLIRP